MDLSFVIPAKDEQHTVKTLHQEIIHSLKSLNKTYEIIFIDDGSTDNTFNELKEIRKKDDNVKIIKLRGNFGKSVALQIGFENSTGDIILTLDADLQDNPEQIPDLLSAINQGYDLVSGWKKKRYDPSLSKVLPSKIINWLTRIFTNVPIHDINCGFKAYRREVVKNLNLYGELYRYIPILAFKQHFKVGEVIVEHRPRRFGKSKFGWERGIKGILDLLTVVFITSFIRRPGHFFGSLGLGSFSIGFVIGIYISYLRITTGGIQYRQPLLFLGMLLMIIGIQFISTGLLAEMFISSKPKPDYSAAIKEKL